MTGFSLTNTVLIPIGLGLIGFIEPCSVGSSLLFIKQMEGKDAAGKLAQVILFMLTRAVFIGVLGVLAVVLGTAFLSLQKSAWFILGAVYVLIGALYMTGKARVLMVSIGPSLSHLAGPGGAVGLGLLFGLNIPACAAPLILALLGTAAAGGVAGRTLAEGFVSLALFGLALSLPLVVAVLVAPARKALDRLAGLSRRMPFWTGVILMALGLWSIYFGLFVSLGPTA